MKLYIAEKPSLGRAIANALPKPHKKHQGYIELANGDVVTWCIGHLLEQADPDAYDAKFKKWSLEHLPIVPDKWQLNAKTKTRSQLTIIKKLIKQAKILVHAGDPDREGQLLVDEVINHLGVSDAKKSTTLRLLINDMNQAAVVKALNNLQSNADYMPLSIAALARSRADWLYGINLTRALTIQGQKVGYQGVLSVGRVQTPVLGLVVKRDNEIKHFTTKPYYQVDALLHTDKQEAFVARWQPSDACQPYMDEEGRVLVKALAENVVSRISNQQGEVTDISIQDKQNKQPLPFNLSSLQISAAKRFNMSAKQVLDVCQQLYEKHKIITYPRSDCRYLPKAQLAQAANIVGFLTKYPDVKREASDADLSIVSSAWNDKKVGAHHAIVPTEKSPINLSLSNAEQNIYQLIARQYLAQFYPNYRYQHQKVSITIAGGLFVAKSNTVQELGWKALFNSKSVQDNDNLQTNLPPLTKGQLLTCHQGVLKEKLTQPPQAFTDATLLEAMTAISRFVEDKSLKSILKETDGLGTEATRAGIIDLLFKRGFLVRNGKSIHATEAGVGLINALPKQCSTPDMTAHWESTLNLISEKQASYQHLMVPLTSTLTALIDKTASELPKSLQGVKAVARQPFKKRRNYRKKATV
ncbi:DNA topoisomerase III [Thalassotalea ganghwensis]